MSNKTIRFIDLFAGVGGIRIGLEQALNQLGIKHECVFTSEIKTHAISVYKDNFPNSQISGDITKISSTDIPDFDVLLAGFPCQPFSSAGLKMGFEDARGTLFFEIARILKDKQPEYFLLENVENLQIHDLTKEDKKNGETVGKTLKTILKILEELNYHVTWSVLQASDFGVAQIRRRIYIVGCKHKKIELDNFEKKTKYFGDIQEHGKPCIDNAFTKNVLSYLKNNNLPITHLYDKSIRDKRGKENNLHSWHLQLRGTTNQSQCDMLERMVTERRNKELARKKGVPLKDGVGLDIEELKAIYTGNNLIDDITDLLNKGYLKKQILPTYNETIYDIVCGRLSFQFTKFLDPNKFALTLVATDAIHTGVVEKDGIRNLTIRECLRLNGFPEDYKMNVEYRKALDLLGNSVVVPVINAICNRMFNDIAG